MTVSNEDCVISPLIHSSVCTHWERSAQMMRRHRGLGRLVPMTFGTTGPDTLGLPL